MRRYFFRVRPLLLPDSSEPVPARRGLLEEREAKGATGTAVRISPIALGRLRDPAVAATAGLTLIAVEIAAAAALRESFRPTFIAISVLFAVVGILWPFANLSAAVLVSLTFGWVVAVVDISAFQIFVAGAGIGLLRSRRRDLATLARAAPREPAVVCAVLFCAWLLLDTVIRSRTADASFVRNYFGAVAFFLLTTAILDTRFRRQFLVGTIIVGSVATAAVGLAQLITTNALVSAWVLPDLRVFQTTYTRFASPWGLGAVGSNYGKDVLVGFMLSLALLLGTNVRRRISLLGVTAVLGVSLFVSGSRSALFGTIVASVYLLIVGRRWRLAAVTAFVLSLLTVALVFPTSAERVQVAVGLKAETASPTHATEATSNLLGNADFESGKRDWVGNSAHLAIEDHPAGLPRGKAARVQTLGHTSGEGLVHAAVPATPHLPSTTSMWLDAPKGARLALRVEWLGRNGLFVVAHDRAFTAQGTWQQVGLDTRSPAETVYARPTLYTVGIPKRLTFFAGLASFTQQSPQQQSTYTVGGVRDSVSTEMSTNLRRRLSIAGLRMVRDQPLFGVGPGAFKDYVDHYAGHFKPGQLIDRRQRLSAHDVPLELWADSGTPALVLYLGFLFAVLAGLEIERRFTTGIERDLTVGLSAALIGLMVTYLFHNYESDNLLWAICGIAISMRLWRRIQSRSRVEPESLASGGHR